MFGNRTQGNAMPTSKPSFTTKQFDALVPLLIKRLTAALEKEQSDCSLPELGGDPNSDLWDLPYVDSKTICKLSPVVKELTGRGLEPSWIRKGGYPSVDVAVEDLIAQMRRNCIIDVAPENSATVPALTLTH
jgi:hypothetical protein